MKCPNCNAETSDMLARCELCGASLVQGGPTEGIPFTGGQPPQAPQAPQYQQPGYPGGGVPPAPGEVPLPPPSDANYYDYGRQGQPPGGTRKPSKPGNPWYMTPLPYAVGIVVLLVIIGSVFAVKKSAKAYPALVLNQQPTLLDIYTDT
jgi:hypothetical protein